MKIWVFSHLRNEARILPFFIRHYAAFAEQIHIFDDNSDDGSQAIISSHPKCVLHSISMGGIHEDELLSLAYENYPMARGKADLIMWVDIDEFVYHPTIKECLQWHLDQGHQAIRTVGFNMMGSPIPDDDGNSQLPDILRTGVRAPIYSKSVVISPDVSVNWSRGKHHLIDPDMKVSPEDHGYEYNPNRLKLLHYRFLTPEYTEERNARQYGRCKDTGAAWSCLPTHTGEHSPSWVARTRHLARDVVDLSSCYLPPPNDA